MTEPAIRVGQLLRLLLGSDKPGEIVATAAALKRALHSAGLDHHRLAAVVETGLAAPAEKATEQAADTMDWRSVAWELYHHRDLLSPKEAAFVAKVVTYRRSPSERQLDWLFALAETLRRDERWSA